MENIWNYVGVVTVIVAVICLLVLAGAVITAPHTVQQYYVGHPQNQTTGYCVLASINWDNDDVVFCSDDIQKVTETADKLNSTLKR